MRCVVRKSLVHVVGGIWMPYGAMCAMDYELSANDVENCRDDDGKITRESVEDWLSTHSGDFSSVVDFCASIEDGDATVDIPWATEEGEIAYLEATCHDD